MDRRRYGNVEQKMHEQSYTYLSKDIKVLEVVRNGQPEINGNNISNQSAIRLSSMWSRLSRLDMVVEKTTIGHIHHKSITTDTIPT